MLSLIADHWHHHDGDWFPFFPIVPLVIIGIWVAVIVTVRRRWAATCGYRSGESVLAERFARGEIDESEYRDRREVLRNRKRRT